MTDWIDEVLVVDENPGDRRFIEEAFDAAEMEPAVHAVSTIEDAMDLINQRGRFALVEKPDVVLLDWNLGRGSGDEVLTEMRTSLPATPVVVMTGSHSEEVVFETSTYDADLCIEKPTTLEGYIEALRSLSERIQA